MLTSSNLLKFNINKNTRVYSIYLLNSEKSLDSREDLVNFYNGKNRLKGQFDYIKTL